MVPRVVDADALDVEGVVDVATPVDDHAGASVDDVTGVSVVAGALDVDVTEEGRVSARYVPRRAPQYVPLGASLERCFLCRTNWSPRR